MAQSLNSITLLVRDYDEAIAYFTQKLGFTLVDDFPMEGEKRWVRVVPKDSTGSKLLLAQASTEKQAHLIGKQTAGRVAFFLRTDEFWSDYKRMKDAGVEFAEEPRKETYGTVVIFKDLYGNKWDLVQPSEDEDRRSSNPWKPIVLVSLFAIAFAFVESSVVLYLRALYYPNGFAFPLKPMLASHITVELAREFSTIVMLAAVGLIAGTSRWQKFSYFLLAFGVWDIFYYVWLKVMLNWPASIFDSDILFLIPVPWIGPVVAPVLISIVMIAGAVLILLREERRPFRPDKSAWIASILGTAVVLVSFMLDTGATLHFQPPTPYRYDLMGVGLCLYGWGLFTVWKRSKS